MELVGTVNRITYHNDTNDYTIMKCLDENNKIVPCIGYIPDAKPGQKFTFKGEYVFSKKYGDQFKFDSYSEEIPMTKRGLTNYLSSGVIRGVGPKLAEAIYDTFGKNSITVLDNTPYLLKQIPGIGDKKVGSIKESWDENRGTSEIMMFLQGCDITPHMAAKIFRRYKNKARQILEQNPYRLIRDIDGVGFKSADSIAKKMGIPDDDPRRLRAAITYLLECETQLGHCFSTRDDIVRSAQQMINIDPEKMDKAINDALGDKSIVFENNVYWLPGLIDSEKKVARNIKRIQSVDGTTIDQSIVQSIIMDGNIDYSETQIAGIMEAASNKIFVLTGGPGTGKSTISKAIIDMFEEAGINCALAAPTGRAAKRLSEATNRDALTIHRLLGFNPAEGFQCSMENQLGYGAILVDEASMIDIDLMAHLFEAIRSESRLILVGDTDQLPSVGAGNVLCDIIHSGVVPVRKLDVIYRQREGSPIVDCAHKVNAGYKIYPTKDKSQDFAFYGESEPEIMADMVVDLMQKYIKSNNVSIRDIQVLYPQKQRECIGTFALNDRLQNEFNPTGIKIETTNFRVGDKVMQLKNNYDKNIFNGDIGYIESYDKVGQQFVVDFEYKKVTYDLKDRDELILAYACTVHKSQGSEYPYVIMLFAKIMPGLLCRNLLYTGITRAKRHLDLIGGVYEVNKAVENNHVAPRRTMLKQRLMQVK